jgi:hypothetical protein
MVTAPKGLLLASSVDLLKLCYGYFKDYTEQFEEYLGF